MRARSKLRNGQNRSEFTVQQIRCGVEEDIASGADANGTPIL